MKFKRSKVLFLVFCCLLLLISIGSISAADINGSDVNDEITSDINNNQHDFSSENIQETKAIKKLDSTNISKEGNIKKEKNTINKNIKSNQNKTVKKADVPYNVNDFNSLRTTWEQIQTSGSTSDNYIINLAEGTYTFTTQLTSTSTLHLNITINGGNPANTIFDGQGNVRFFDIQSQDITLNNITFRNGFVRESQGGAISLSQGNIHITNSTFRNNTAISTESSTIYNAISGGALYIANSTNSVLINNTFKALELLRIAL